MPLLHVCPRPARPRSGLALHQAVLTGTRPVYVPILKWQIFLPFECVLSFAGIAAPVLHRKYYGPFQRLDLP
jgi:hypothetical protein